MKDGVYLRQVIDVIDEIEFDDVKESHAFGFVYEEILRSCNLPVLPVSFIRREQSPSLWH